MAATLPKRPPTVYQRIMAADRDGRGLRLSPQEVSTLAQDDAINQLAESDDEGGSWVGKGFGTNEMEFIDYKPKEPTT